MSNTHLIWSRHFLRHVTPVGHPEQPARASVMQRVAENWMFGGGSTSEPSQGTMEHILRVHSRQHQIQDQLTFKYGIKTMFL